MECPQNAIIAVNFPPRKPKPTETAPMAETSSKKTEAPKVESPVAPKPAETLQSGTDTKPGTPKSEA